MVTARPVSESTSFYAISFAVSGMFQRRIFWQHENYFTITHQSSPAAKSSGWGRHAKKERHEIHKDILNEGVAVDGRRRGTGRLGHQKDPMALKFSMLQAPWWIHRFHQFIWKPQFTLSYFYTRFNLGHTKGTFHILEILQPRPPFISLGRGVLCSSALWWVGRGRNSVIVIRRWWNTGYRVSEDGGQNRREGGEKGGNYKVGEICENHSPLYHWTWAMGTAKEASVEYRRGKNRACNEEEAREEGCRDRPKLLDICTGWAGMVQKLSHDATVS